MVQDPPQSKGVHPKAQNPFRVTLYIPDKELPWVLEMKKALQRDGSSLSEFSIVQWKEWWEKHRPGNPQTGLERFESTAQLQPGPHTPGSAQYRDREGVWHWVWTKDLPYGPVVVVRRDGSRLALRSDQAYGD